jgi:hypothetical protein
VHEESHADFWVEQIRLTEAADAMESNSDSEGSAPIPNDANANFDSPEVGSDDNSLIDTPHLLSPFNARSNSVFYVPADAQSRPNWATNMNFLDPNYTAPDPIPDEATNTPHEWVHKLKN